MTSQCNPTCAPAQAAKSGAVRLWGLLGAAGAMAVLGVAAWMVPRPNGHGTHQELGMPPCSMIAELGWPCPTCGMTTSVSQAVRGRLGEAFHAHPFGLVLTATLAVVMVLGLAQAISGRCVLGRLGVLGWWWAVILGGGLLAGWGYKALAGWASGEFPLR